MLYLILTHWLWCFGALTLGIAVGWVTYLLAATHWTDRPVHIAGGIVVLGAVLALSKVVPARYGYWLEIGVIFTVFYAIGCFIGWALRDIAEFTPAVAKSRVGAPAAGTGDGTYLFRSALAGTGAGTAYMRSSTDGAGASPRARLALGTGALTQAPAAGGYTFPKSPRFADAATSPLAATTTGARRHWTYPGRAGADGAGTLQEFTGSPGGYVFPAAALAALPAATASGASARTGLYRHWSWRSDDQGVATPGTQAAAPAFIATSPVAPPVAAPSAMRGTETGGPTTTSPVAPRTPPVAAAVTPDRASASSANATPRAASAAATMSEPKAPPSGGASAQGPSATAATSSTPSGVAIPTAAPTSSAATTSGTPATVGSVAGTAPGMGSAGRATPAGPAGSAGTSQSVGTAPTGKTASAPGPSAPGPARDSGVSTSAGGRADGGMSTPSGASAPAPGAAAISSGVEQTAKTPTPAAGIGRQPGQAGLASSTAADRAPSVPASSGTPTGAAGQTSSASTATASGGLSAGPSVSQPEPSTPSAAQAIPTRGAGRSDAMPAPAPTGTRPTAQDRPSAGTDPTASPPIMPPSASGTGTASPAGTRPAPVAPAARPAGLGSATAPSATATATAGTIGPAGGSSSAPPAAAATTAGAPMAPPSPAAAPSSDPPPAPPVPDQHKHPGARPDGLIAARDNRADDLKRVRGIGPQNEGRLHGLGIWHFDQIAAWTPDNVKWVGSYLAFHGRIDREKWIEQAAVLAAGQDTEFSKRVASGRVASSRDDGSHGQSNVDKTMKPRT